MDKKTQRKRPAVKSSIKQAGSTNTAVAGDSSNPVVTNIHTGNRLDSLGIKLNKDTAKQAVILSEIIGKPVSKRRK